MELEALIERRPQRRSELKDWYQRLLHAADAAGVSVAQLAARLGCCAETIYGWRRRLQGTAGEEPTARGSRGLVQVRVVQGVTDRCPSGLRMELRLSSGQILLIPEGFDPAVVAQVVQALARC